MGQAAKRRRPDIPKQAGYTAAGRIHRSRPDTPQEAGYTAAGRIRSSRPDTLR